MKRRVIAAVTAVLLAGVGAVVLLGWVANADRRAMADMQPVDVLVVEAPVREGTTAEALVKLVTTKTLPAVAITEGALSSLSSISGQVATTDLQPGEQVLPSRFADPASLAHADDVRVPLGLQQLALSLDPQRALGGHLAAGSTVGVFISLPKDGVSPAQTHLVQHKVLVTKVDGAASATPAPAAGDAPATSSGAQLMVTVAVNAHDAETLVYGAEHGTVWLSLEPVDAAVSGSRVVTRANVNK
jgi:pilus assembly protein CpaB